MAVLRAGASLKHGTFVVASLLGRGGFGEVYLARQPRMDRDVAIKVLSPSVAEEPEIVRRFEREALAAGKLQHPNVLPVFDFDFDEEAHVWFLAMQYVPGGKTLQSLMKGPMDPWEVARITTAVASALDAAHAQDIIHRDVKPPNVLMDEQNRPLLTDFGIAHLNALTGMTQQGMAIGTPAYVSPEQGMGKSVGPASDQYSLAVMVYQMLAGRPPFTGDSLSLVMQHVSAPPPAITTWAPHLPVELEAALHRALSKAPEHRFPTCSAFAAALSTAVAHLTPAETIATPVDGVGPAAPPTVPSLPPGSAVSMGHVSPGSRTVVSEAPVVRSGVNGAAVASSGTAASERAIPAPARKLPVPLVAGSIGAVMLVLVGVIAVRQLTGAQTAGPPVSPTTAPTLVAIGPTEAPMQPDMGVVEIDTVPTGILMVNNESAGRTPARTRLEAGRYELKVVAPTYQEWTQTVTVEPGKTFTIPRFSLVPVPTADVVLDSVTEARLGKNPFVDAGEIVRLSTYTDQFQVGDGINAIVYLTPKSKGIRDLSMNLTMRWQRAGEAPLELKGEQRIDQAWSETFIRACAPGYALDPRGSNTPLSVSIFVDDVLIRTFEFRVGPGPTPTVNECDTRDLPSSTAAS